MYDIADVAALAAATEIAPWALVTLDAVARHTSLRQAAVELHLHPSSLRERVTASEAVLGIPTSTAAGRLRLQLALALRWTDRNRDLG